MHGQHICSGMGRSYGVAYWHARFPDWPLKIRCCKGPAPGHLLPYSIFVLVTPVGNVLLRACCTCNATYVCHAPARIFDRRRVRVQIERAGGHRLPYAGSQRHVCEHKCGSLGRGHAGSWLLPAVVTPEKCVLLSNLLV